MNTIPNLSLVDDRWEGTVSLPAWKDFQSRQGAYASRDADETSNGVFGISIGGDMSVDNPVVTIEHLNAYNYLVANSEQTRDSILTTLLGAYKALQADYGYDAADAKEIMPDIDSKEEFRNLIGLSLIHIMHVDKDGVAYVGYEIGCSWDEEHGLGFMTHKDRIIDWGGADMAFLTWVARKDLEAGIV